MIDTRDAHETDNDTTVGSVVDFGLCPQSELPTTSSASVTPTTDLPVVDTVPVEGHHSERTFTAPSREPYEFERREAELVNRYRRLLQSQGHVVSRLRVVPAGEGSPLYSDLWDETSLELVEAKGNVTRDAIRLAVGQLLDYGRFVKANARTVLVPSRPRDDLVEYLVSAGIAVVYPDGDSWHRDDPAPE
jgi:hypothetical protein